MKKRLSALSVAVLATAMSGCGSGARPPAGLAAEAPAAASLPGTTSVHTASCPLPADGEMYAEKPAAQLGFNQARLDAAIRFGTRLLSSSVRVYRHGCLAGKSAIDRLDAYEPQALYSGSKSVLSLAVGRAVTLGYLGLDDPIGKYLPEADAAHAAITVRQLLNQTSGLQLVAADEAGALLTDPVKYTLALPFWYRPGTEFMYAQNTLTMLSRVLERATGMEFQAFTQQQLMNRVGIPRDHWTWSRDRSGHTFVWGGLEMRPDDEARLGHLMLHEGRWGNQQIISRDYMAQATTGTKANPGLGFLLWLNSGDHYKASLIGRPQLVAQPMLPGSPRDTFGAMGAMGQMIIVVPSRDLVLVRNGAAGGGLATVEGPDYHELVREVVAAVDDMPRDTDPGPYAYPAPTATLDLLPSDNKASDSRLTGMWFGVGAGATPGCTLLVCDGSNLATDAVRQRIDSARQSLAAGWATTTDLARSFIPR